MGNCCFGKKHVAHDHNQYQVRIENALNRIEEREIDQTLAPAAPAAPVAPVAPVAPAAPAAPAAPVAQLNREDAAAIVYNPLVYNPHHRINYLPNTKVVGYGYEDRYNVTRGNFKPLDLETTMPCCRKNQFYC